MNTRILSLAASLAMSVSGVAIAQTAYNSTANHAEIYSVASSAVGRWIYDLQGNIIGSVRSLTDDGRTAVIMVGSYFQPGSHEAQVPNADLSIVNGKVTLQAGTVQALNTVSRR